LTAKKKMGEPEVRIAPLGEVRAYMIYEHELENLALGTPVSDLLTVGLCLLSAALTILATLLSTTLSDLKFTLFFCALLIFGLAGGICTFLGCRLRTGTTELVREIRARMPDTPSVQPLPSTSTTGQMDLPPAP
jgi:hypothetical protein